MMELYIKKIDDMKELIPFNIGYRDKIESGEYKVVTRCGYDVRILSWNVGTVYCQGIDGEVPYSADGSILFCTDDEKGGDAVHITNGEGHVGGSGWDGPYDLFIDMGERKNLGRRKVGNLTLLQIAEMVARGEMPDGYEISYKMGGEPGVMFDDEVIGERIDISRDDVPVPEKVLVKGENVVNLEWYRYAAWEGKDEVVEFGPVKIETYGKITGMKFVYPCGDREKVRAWVENTMERWVDRKLSKKDVVFDMSYVLGDMKRNFFDVSGCEVNYPENDGGDIKVSLTCDHFKLW